MDAATAPDVSICIATFRRPHGLPRLLTSLSALKLPDDFTLEVVVVDNDASGGARERASAACDFARTARWLIEPRQNIALARNRALDAATGRWVAFIDDDEVADERWLAAFWSQVEQDAGDGFFGPVIPQLERMVTPWLDVDSFFGRRRHPTGTPVGAADVSTSNALIRRALLADQRFDPAWGRTGGSDLELFDRLLSSGARFLWCDEAIVSERIPVGRHRLRWLTQRAFRGGVGFTRLQLQRRRQGAVSRGLPRALLAAAALLALLPFARLRGKAAAARVWLRLCVQVGHLWAFAGRSYEEYGAARAKHAISCPAD
jgi:succinoglycan biosynthesis protein ExoM